MRRTWILLVLATGLATLGCKMVSFAGRASSGAWKSDNQKVAAHAASDARAVPDREKSPQTSDEPLANVHPRKVVYTAQLEIIVADLNRALDEAQKAAEGMGGYMQHLSSEGITIRIPAKKFNDAIDILTKLGPVANREITACDVTERYTDMEIRLANGRAALKRLETLLDKAANVKDVLAIEKELIRVRTEIERLQGKINVLNSRIAYATITVSFSRAAHVSEHIRVKLPFWWLAQLGLETLMDF